jgi:hypothetical protein
MVIAAVGLSGCGWMNRDRNAGYSSAPSGTSTAPSMQGTDQDATKGPPSQEQPLPEQQQHY